MVLESKNKNRHKISPLFKCIYLSGDGYENDNASLVPNKETSKNRKPDNER